MNMYMYVYQYIHVHVHNVTWMDGWIDRLTDGRIDGQTNAQTSTCNICIVGLTYRLSHLSIHVDEYTMYKYIYTCIKMNR